MDHPKARILVAGGGNLLAKPLCHHLQVRGYEQLLQPTAEPDWTDAAQVDSFFARQRPEIVFMLAGRSGGIAANQRTPAQLLRDNLLTSANAIDSAHRHGVKRMLYLAPACVYPRDCPQPMKVSSLWGGPLEPTNEGYAAAKLAGIAMCQAYCQQYGASFRVGITANPYGGEENFEPEASHVIPALIAKFHQAKETGFPTVQVWGSGEARREFIFVDDLAGACVFVMEHEEGPSVINLGTGQELSIRELSQEIKEIVGFTGRLEFDAARPDGMPRKFLDCAPLYAMGWRPAVSLREGLQRTYEGFLRTDRMSRMSRMMEEV